MLTPPAPETPPASKRSEAVFIADRLDHTPDGWVRITTFCFEGEIFEYALEAPSARSEEDARRIMYASRPNQELEQMFLKHVSLDMTRPH